MDYLSTKNELDILVNPILDDFIKLSQALFYIKEIELIPEQLITVSETTILINNGNSIKIEGVEDKNCKDSLILISCGHLFISHYADFIKTLEGDVMLSFDAKKKQVLKALYKLDKYSKAHNINNRFSFTSKRILKVKCSIDNATIDYNNLILTTDQNNLLRELFLIRQEIFTELLDITNSFLHYLEYNAYRYSKFQMDEEKGKYLIHELIIGLGAKNEYINLNESELQQLEKILFQLFGLKPPEFGRMRDKILKRTNPAKGLDSLSHNVEIISKELKKLHNK